MDIEKVSFSSASSFTDEKATPVPVVAPQSYFNRLALRLFPKNRSGSGKSNCFTDLYANGSSQSLANKLATVESAQEKESGATNTTLGFETREIPGEAPYKGYYGIETADGHWLIKDYLVNRQSKPLLDLIFGKDSLKDISAYPAATLPNYDNITLGIFVEWIHARGSKPMKSDDLFEEKVCTRKERVHTIDVIMELLFFAEEYKIYEFQDDVLELLINLCMEDDLPLDVSHVEKCHSRTSQDSMIRAFFIDFINYIIQEIDDSGILRRKKAGLNCDLSLKKRGTLLKLYNLLEGRNNRHRYGYVSDPREAPSCVYHHHGSTEKCPHKTLASSCVSELIDEKA